MSPRRAKAVKGRVGDDPATAMRDHLVDTAERLLSERVVSTITTRDIARAAQVSDGVLYNYFTDKHELLLTALVRRYARVAERFGTDLPEPGTSTVAENLLRYAHATLDLMSQALPAVAGLIHEPTLLHRFIAAIHTQPYGPHLVQGPILDYLRGEQRLGRVGPVVPEAAFAMLFGSTMTLAISVLIGGRARDHVEHDLPSVVEAMMRGLAP
jgi:AcrR family transcriptional regulator